MGSSGVDLGGTAPEGGAPGRDFVSIYPISTVLRDLAVAPFTPCELPFHVFPSVAVEDARQLVSGDAFKWLERELGESQMRSLRGIDTALVRRRRARRGAPGESFYAESAALIRKVAACLRVIRPTRQSALLVQGEWRREGFNARTVDHPILMDVPGIQKMYSVHQDDLVRLRALAPKFLAAFDAERWKFRMAVQFHDAGHFVGQLGDAPYWKSRLALWMAGLDALFTTDHPNHRGGRVTKARISWFLGEGTPIFDDYDRSLESVIRPSGAPVVPTVGEVLPRLFELRNLVVHGERVPEAFFGNNGGCGAWVGAPETEIEALLSAASAILRMSLIKVLDQDLLDHFSDAPRHQAYFAHLTKSTLRDAPRAT